MGQIRLHSKENPDGTFTYHAKCRLETVTGVQGETFDNPIRTIVWNAIQNKYVVKGGIENNDDDDDAANDKDLFYDNNNDDDDDDDDFYDFANNRTGNQPPKTILGRECWCARLFHENQPDFEIDNFLEIGDEASFCPIDSNADGLLSKRDVRVCDAQAVIDRYGQILSKDQQCHSELPMAEFAKSTWPLCFFWWILLVYMLCGTHYGSRVMGYIKRNLLLKCIAIKKSLCGRGRGGRGGGSNTGRRRGRTEEGTAQATAAAPTTTTIGEQPPSQDDVPRNSDAGDNGNSNDNADEEQQQGGESDSSEPRRRPDPPEQRRSIPPPPPPPPLPPPRSETDVEDRSDWTERNAAIIERDFGSHDNYLILDRELRYQANASNNEFVTWLWYSAVYTEVRRFRYERWVRRRERERFRRLGRTPSEEAEDNEDSDGDDIEASTGWLQGSRRLDRVFWWPPSGPDGSRWEHLQRNNANSNQPPTNEDGRPIDPSRLNLKTKRFFLDDTGNDTENHTTPPTEDEPANVSEYKVPEVPDNLCSICLCELEDGDLVGDIPCGHLFHKDCLKEWLTKNNHCPICRLENIAHHPVGRPRCVRTPRTTTNDTAQDSDRIQERTSVPLLFGW